MPPQIETSGWIRSNAPRSIGRARVAWALEQFAAGQRERQPGAQPLVVDVAVGRERLLEPAEAEVVERLADPHRVAERVGRVAVGHEIEGILGERGSELARGVELAPRSGRARSGA